MERLYSPALSLFERLTVTDQDLLRTAPRKRFDLVQRWQEVLGGEAALTRRLSWAGLTPGSVAAALDGKPELVSPVQSLPKAECWEVLDEVLKTASQGSLSSLAADDCLEHALPLPFETVLVPFVTVARRLVKAAYDALSGGEGTGFVLMPDARREMERFLLQRLTSLAAPTLYHELAARRSLEPPLSSLFGNTDQTHSTRIYDGFIAATIGDLGSFFATFPVLGRLLALVVIQWVDMVSELTARLRADEGPILQLFHPHEGNGCRCLCSVSLGLSDPHRGGRAVARLLFSCGTSLFYKPRSLLAEKAFYEVLRWFSEEGPGCQLKLPLLLAHRSHGWMEGVAADPLDTTAQAASYYRRCGLILCFLYVTGASDCHFENWIAAGEFPTLIDAECLLRPQIRSGADAEGTGALLDDSVVRTGLLPRWEVYQGQAATDISGMSGTADVTPTAVLGFASINTDQMRLTGRPVKLPGVPNRPSINGQVVSSGRYVDEVCEGFSQAYDFLLERREALLASPSAFDALKEIPVRLVLRPTAVYGKLLQAARHPDLMRCGATRSLLFEQLALSFLGTGQDTIAQFWPMLESELNALEQLDVPHYWVRADSTAVEAGGLRLEDCFSLSGYELMRRRFAAMGEADRRVQLTLIRESLLCRAAMADGSPTEDRFAGKVADDEPVLDDDESLRLAEEIGKILADSVVNLEPDDPTWVAVQHTDVVAGFEHQRLGLGLYDGVMGLALFLAALSVRTGKEEYRGLALRTIAGLRRSLTSPSPGTAFPVLAGLGAGSGLGGVVYGLATLGRISEDPALLRDAETAATLVTAELIRADRALDIIGGTAGVLLALLALKRSLARMGLVPHVDLESRLRQCGERLVGSLHSSPSPGTRAWSTLTGRFLTGMSHGAAGIAMALLRLYRELPEPDSRYVDAALEGIRFETVHFDKVEGNWKDFRADQQGRYMTAWCNGAPGIALARTATLEVLDAPEIRADIEAGIQTTLKMTALRLDHLCCGTFGRALVLSEIGNRLGRPELGYRARQMRAATIRRAGASHDFRLFLQLSGKVLHPGFFQGLSGIGYELLRSRSQARLPCVLLFD
ncbi:MAG: type 2 lantipeptide synthetase LanM [Acidobacteria bacterium]|nr:MAG: type 2 lantipeptide synthetase LanM [Acidobacteriota bacterium]